MNDKMQEAVDKLHLGDLTVVEAAPVTREFIENNMERFVSGGFSYTDYLGTKVIDVSVGMLKKITGPDKSSVWYKPSLVMGDAAKITFNFKTKKMEMYKAPEGKYEDRINRYSGSIVEETLCELHDGYKQITSGRNINDVLRKYGFTESKYHVLYDDPNKSKISKGIESFIGKHAYIEASKNIPETLRNERIIFDRLDRF